MPASDLQLLKKWLGKLAVYLTVWLAGQTVAAVWWASAIDTRMAFQEKLSERLDARLYRIETGGERRTSNVEH